VLPLLAFVALTTPACVDASATRPVLAQQRETIERLDRLSAQDHAALRALTDALLDAQRERLLASIELDIVAYSLDAHGNAPSGAPQWLMDYADSWRAGDDADARRAPLQAREDVAEFDRGARALRDSLESRAIVVGALFANVLADNAALSEAAGATVDLSLASREAALELWREAVVERIDDPDRRAAASRLLDNLLNPSN
jgi:hypothetical protein